MKTYIEINGGKYRIESVNYGFVLIEKKNGKNKSNKDVEYDLVVGYYGNIQQLKAGLFQHGITSDINLLNNIGKCEEMYEKLRKLEV